MQGTLFYAIVFIKYAQLLKYQSNFQRQDSEQIIIKMSQCHICSLQLNDPGSFSTEKQQPTFLAKCCIKRCNKKYCLKCIRQKFDSGFQQQMYKSDTWICYSCQQLCGCAACRGLSSDKKTNKKKSIQNSMGSKQQLKLQSKQQIIEQFYTQEQINCAAPFMRRILQRRNLMYKLMGNADNEHRNQKGEELCKQECKSSGKDIKQLIRKTLKEYNQDQGDIQLID